MEYRKWVPESPLAFALINGIGLAPALHTHLQSHSFREKSRPPPPSSYWKKLLIKLEPF